MLAEGDPLALELRSAWNGLPMTNLQLGAADVDALLEYIEDESFFASAVEEARGEDASAAEGERAPCCRKAEELVLSTAEPARRTSRAFPLAVLGALLALGVLVARFARRGSPGA